MKALIFLVDSLLTLAVYVFLLRLLLQLCRADFRNPLAQAIVRLSNWLVLPLRRLLPPMGRVDTASVVAVYAVQVAAICIVLLLTFGAITPWPDLLLYSVRKLIITALQLYTVAIVIYALLSFLAPGSYSPASSLLDNLCEPLLRPIRRLLPPLGGLDFSPLVVILGLQALKILLSS